MDSMVNTYLVANYTGSLESSVEYRIIGDSNPHLLAVR
jgi:hypothetical protein